LFNFLKEENLKAKINFEGIINDTNENTMEVIGSTYPTNAFDRGNLHSIEPFEGPVIFIDIQSPPPQGVLESNPSFFFVF
jgi:hypothetical protein